MLLPGCQRLCVWSLVGCWAVNAKRLQALYRRCVYRNTWYRKMCARGNARDAQDMWTGAAPVHAATVSADDTARTWSADTARTCIQASACLTLLTNVSALMIEHRTRGHGCRCRHTPRAKRSVVT